MSGSNASDRPMDEGDALVDRAVAMILAQPVPPGLREAVIARAAGRSSRRPRRWVVALASAACLMGGAVGLAFLRGSRSSPSPVVIAEAGQTNGESSPKTLNLQGSSAGDEAPPRPTSRGAFARVPVTQCLVADAAPVIVITDGRAEPLRLGEVISIAGYGAAVHVWDWSKSRASRLVESPALGEREVWSLVNQRAALSPDGRRVAWTGGLVLDLADGTTKQIDLGGTWYRDRAGNPTQPRLGDIGFSPDGRRLALLISVREDGQLRGSAVRMVDLDSGERICQFPVQEYEFRLHVAFTPDGRRIGCSNPDGHLLLRDTSTGEVLARFEPPLSRPLAAVAISPDGTWIAASESAGDVFLWELATRRLARRIPIPFREPLRLDPTLAPLRFSPDSQRLAGADQERVSVFDVADGRLVAELDQPGAAMLQWSADGKVLTAVTAVTMEGGALGGEGEPPRERLPSVHEWDWRAGEPLSQRGNP